MLIWLCLSARPEASESDFTAAVFGLIRSARVCGDGVATVSGFYRLGIDPILDTAHGREMAGGPEPFDAIVELAGDGRDLRAAALECCSSAAAQLTTVVDAAESAVIAGTPYVFSDGSGTAMNAFCIRPARGRTIDECQEHWTALHRGVIAAMTKPDEAGVAATVKPLTSYTQFHADPSLSGELADPIGFVNADFMGVARTFTDSPDAINLRLKSKEVSTIALLDERAFIDHSRSSMALYARLPHRADSAKLDTGVGAGS